MCDSLVSAWADEGEWDSAGFFQERFQAPWRRPAESRECDGSWVPEEKLLLKLIQIADSSQAARMDLDIRRDLLRCQIYGLRTLSLRSGRHLVALQRMLRQSGRDAVVPNREEEHGPVVLQWRRGIRDRFHGWWMRWMGERAPSLPTGENVFAEACRCSRTEIRSNLPSRFPPPEPLDHSELILTLDAVPVRRYVLAGVSREHRQFFHPVGDCPTDVTGLRLVSSRATAECLSAGLKQVRRRHPAVHLASRLWNKPR
jgi:hypothetical protein